MIDHLLFLQIEYHGEFNEKSIVETPHMFQAATTFARGALRRWQQLTGLPIKVGLSLSR
jgi:hypothetical protein